MAPGDAVASRGACHLAVEACGLRQALGVPANPAPGRAHSSRVCLEPRVVFPGAHGRLFTLSGKNNVPEAKGTAWIRNRSVAVWEA